MTQSSRSGSSNFACRAAADFTPSARCSLLSSAPRFVFKCKWQSERGARAAEAGETRSRDITHRLHPSRLCAAADSARLLQMSSAAPDSSDSPTRMAEYVHVKAAGNGEAVTASGSATPAVAVAVAASGVTPFAIKAQLAQMLKGGVIMGETNKADTQARQIVAQQRGETGDTNAHRQSAGSAFRSLGPQT